MTNEEKALSLSRKYATPKNKNREIAVYQSAVEMANWKDQQIEEELNLIADWFNHIAQMADDKKTLNGFIMKDSDAFDEIRCLAKRSAEYINKRLLK